MWFSGLSDQRCQDCKDKAFNNMTKEELMLKVIELQAEIIRLKTPYITNPFTYVQPDLCTDGSFHNYPSPWMATVPPSCTKCGKQAVNHTLVTCTNNSEDIKWIK